jgi:hypothetical protein
MKIGDRFDLFPCKAGDGIAGPLANTSHQESVSLQSSRRTRRNAHEIVSKIIVARLR